MRDRVNYLSNDTSVSTTRELIILSTAMIIEMPKITQLDIVM